MELTEIKNGNSSKTKQSNLLTTAFKWVLLPIRVVITIAVVLFDTVMSRYLISMIIVGVIWGPLYLIWGLSTNYFIYPSIIIGTCLCGLWDTCKIFTIHSYLPRWMTFISDE